MQRESTVGYATHSFSSLHKSHIGSRSDLHRANDNAAPNCVKRSNTFWQTQKKQGTSNLEYLFLFFTPRLGTLLLYASNFLSCAL